MTEPAMVVKCQKCELVQYFKTPNCRRCGRVLALSKEPDPPALTEPAKKMSMTEQIAKRVYFLRTHRNLSQHQLAEMIDSPRTYVSKIERGRCLPCIGQLDKFAGALKVGVGDFLCTEKEFKIRLLLTDPFISQIAEVGKEMKAYDWMLVLQEAKKLAWPTKVRVR